MRDNSSLAQYGAVRSKQDDLLWSKQDEALKGKQDDALRSNRYDLRDDDTVVSFRLKSLRDDASLA